MSSNIILNKKNIVGSDNNHLVYEFINEQHFDEGDSIGITHLNIYNSFFNITQKNNNNFLQYKFWDSTGNLATFDVNIQDGYYSIIQLYEIILSKMKTNNHYLISPTGNEVYFFELKSNSVYYSTFIRLYSVNKFMTFDGVQYNIESDLVTSYRIPRISGGTLAWVPPQEYYECPQIIIPSTNNFGELLGFKKGSIIQYDSSSDIINKYYDILSDTAPIMEPQSSFLLTCNMIENKLFNPNNVIMAFTNVSNYGETISPIKEVIYSDIKPGNYRYIELKFYDQNFNELIIKDPTMLIVVSIIKNKKQL